MRRVLKNPRFCCFIYFAPVFSYISLLEAFSYTSACTSPMCEERPYYTLPRSTHRRHTHRELSVLDQITLRFLALVLPPLPRGVSPFPFLPSAFQRCGWHSRDTRRPRSSVQAPLPTRSLLSVQPRRCGMCLWSARQMRFSCLRIMAYSDILFCRV